MEGDYLELRAVRGDRVVSARVDADVGGLDLGSRPIADGLFYELVQKCRETFAYSNH